MAEYIEREIAKDELLSWTVCINHPEHLMREDAMHVLDTIPASDVAPIVHGHIVTTSDRWHVFHQNCSECGAELPWKEYPNYCYNCGARMDGGETDA